MEKNVNNFNIKIVLDTQILAYLIDNTFPRLSYFFKLLSENTNVDIVCSRFSTYEFIGIRKLEHYLRKIHLKSNADAQNVNFSSLLKYKNDWNAPELNYSEIYEEIAISVETDLKKINDDFKISLEIMDLHNGIWNPHKDIVLSSKISKEDSLVLMSAVFPQEYVKEDYLLFFTNDDRFFRAFCGDEKIEAIDDVFVNHGIKQPKTYKLINLLTPITNNPLNLIRGDEDNEAIQEYCTIFIREHLLLKYSENYLGKIVSCPKAMKGKLLCFELDESSTLNNNLYLTIIDKNLNGYYNVSKKLTDFYNKTKIENYPYKSTEGDDQTKNISVELKNEDDNYLEEELYNNICSNGNLVFIHPDSFI